MSDNTHLRVDTVSGRSYEFTEGMTHVGLLRYDDEIGGSVVNEWLPVVNVSMGMLRPMRVTLENDRHILTTPVTGIYEV